MGAFTVDQWVFCEFELRQIRHMEGDRVTDVTTGFCSLGSYDLSDRCRPLTIAQKRVADHFHWLSQRIHREGGVGLNYPDIHRWLVEKWCAASDVADDPDRLAECYQEADKFAQDILRAQQVESGYGFPLMRRK